LKPNGKLIIDQKDLIVYDLDMTLVCTEFDFLHECILATAKALGATAPSKKKIWDFWYGEVNREEFIRSVLGIDDPMVFWNLFRTFDTPDARAARTIPFQHVVPTLHALREKGKQQAVITASVMPNAQAEISLLRFLFELVVSVSETPHFKSKPDPKSLIYVMEELDVSPDRTVVVGDSSEDERLANNANVDFVHYRKRDPFLTFDRQILASFDCWSEFSTLQAKTTPS
jgi:phosphoglycolate phosphatase